MIVQAIAAGPGATFYTRFGDWFGWLGVLALGALLVLGAGLRHKPRE
jgi:hypothetical protein